MREICVHFVNDPSVIKQDRNMGKQLVSWCFETSQPERIRPGLGIIVAEIDATGKSHIRKGLLTKMYTQRVS